MEISADGNGDMAVRMLADSLTMLADGSADVW